MSFKYGMGEIPGFSRKLSREGQISRFVKAWKYDFRNSNIFQDFQAAYEPYLCMVCIFVYVCICMHISMHEYIYMYACTHYARMHLCMYVCMYVCM